jgi:peptidyl-prolyl cis-trans isomerase-like 3
MSVTLHTTYGDLQVQVFCDQVPKASKNFLALCASGSYDNTIFHRNVEGCLIQGGDPSGTGKEGKNYQDKFQSDEFLESLKHEGRGIVSFANLNKPETVGSQFFITYAALPDLDGVFTVFGRVIAGLDVLDRMEKAPVGKRHRPVEEIKISKVTIHKNPIAEAELSS